MSSFLSWLLLVNIGLTTLGAPLAELPADDSNPFAMVLSDLVERLHARYASKAKLDATEKKIMEISGSERYCQTGIVGCIKDCGGFDTDSNYQEMVKTFGVTFANAFPRKPTVTLAWMYTLGKVFYYGWNLQAVNVTSTEFTAKITLKARKIDTLRATWIACI